MTTSPHRRIRTAAATLTALTLGAATVGAGIAEAKNPAPLPHTPSSLTNRVLHTTVSGTGANAPGGNQFYYAAPSGKVSYLLTDQFTGSTENSISWEKVTPQSGGKRFVDQVDIYPTQKAYDEQRGSVKDQAAPGLGIQSTGAEVQKAIADGDATKVGMTKIARQTTEELRLKPSAKNVVDDTLYVDQSTDQPVVEIEHVKSGSGTLTVTSNWLAASPQRVSQVESKPSIPSGYKVTG